jgi:hypothetical protein
MHAVVDQEAEVLAHRFEVEGFVGMELTGYGRKDALPTHVTQLDSPRMAGAAKEGRRVGESLISVKYI